MSTATHVRALAAARAFVAAWAAKPQSESHLVMLDQNRVVEKLAAIIADGAKHLHIISDFDMTMTKYWVNGQRGPSSHHVVMASERVSQTLKDESDALYKKYYPIEINPMLGHDEKYAAMEMWWRTAHDVMVREGINESDLQYMVTETPMTWRGGIHDLIKVSGDMGVYFLVFSAGIKNLIKYILEHANLLQPHVHVESNEMIFDEASGRVVRFTEPVIHTLNKSEVVLAGESLVVAPGATPTPQQRHAAAIKGRNNVVVMGDSLGDARMADGVAHQVCLRIGWCNHGEAAWLDQFTATFDVVITGDHGMDWGIEVMQLIQDFAAAEKNQHDD
ncbi:pyrimidine 5'-nucleotidase-domain-containing protein [Blastocladiella britannica]|nr:pyrimidine 5'-nucleotidase-domain-containing protein [Blastocladiella britannica]